ncbi:uncharacterized protein K444DRAFT_253565 [Hyaloscypha bicolor E]|uniref:Uncharacterized protein n=1 Tax=Hyaloscypha bicolor E TaxID=1095630 RepID=A0A2J6SMV1_9HELO|nr:uncharacterized protein K444DRAFT_253565 [Hyaloscypha bicolor E]PMD52106.1 hypothetical protein K444DRAFT_253565 [Hyaloscypha bicolor E]
MDFPSPTTRPLPFIRTYRQQIRTPFDSLIAVFHCPDPLSPLVATRHAPANHSHHLTTLYHKSLPEHLPTLRLVAPVLWAQQLPLPISIASRPLLSQALSTPPDDLHVSRLRSQSSLPSYNPDPAFDRRIIFAFSKTVRGLSI